MSQDTNQDLGDLSRQPPRFVPTLTQIVGPAEPGAAMPAPSAVQPASAVPAVFAELLNDWPTLGNSEAPQSQPSAGGRDIERALDEQAAAEKIARHAEALVMQRLPGLMAGLVAQAVREAMADARAGEARKS